MRGPAAAGGFRLCRERAARPAAWHTIWGVMPLTLTERELLETVRSTDLDSRGRFEYLVLLRRVATSASIPVLAESLGSSDPNVRATALRTLADLGGDEATSLMEGALDSANANTVAWAAAGLEKVNAVVAVPAIVRCLAERRVHLVGDAEKALTRALGVLGDDRVVEELTVSAMQPRRGVRRLGLKALALIGTSGSEAALDGLMSDLSWRDRRLATRHRDRVRNVRA